MTHTPRRLAALALAAGLPLAVSVLAGAPARAAVADSCGGELRDYVGTSEPDAPFAGTFDTQGEKTVFTLTPTEGTPGFVGATIGGEQGPWTVVGPVQLVKQPDGQGLIGFTTSRGAATVEHVECSAKADAPHRVVKMSGTILISPDRISDFELGRS